MSSACSHRNGSYVYKGSDDVNNTNDATWKASTLRIASMESVAKHKANVRVAALDRCFCRILRSGAPPERRSAPHSWDLSAQPRASARRAATLISDHAW